MQTPQATASLPTYPKGVHCTKALHPLTSVVRAVQCAVRFSTLWANTLPPPPAWTVPRGWG